MPLWSGQPTSTPRAAAQAASDAEPVGWPGAVLTFVFVLALCLPFRPYARAARLVERVRSPRLLLGLTAALALVALLIYPRYGSDIFEYVAFERSWLVHGQNPLLATPASHPADWTTPLIWFADTSPAYGPLWAIVTWPVAWLAGGGPTSAVLGYKALALAAYIACAWLVWTIAPAARRRQAFVHFAWSPLVLFEALGKVHNDMLIALGALAAVWLFGRGHRAASLVVVTMTALVKLTALALAPAVALRIWRRDGWRSLALATCAAIGVAIIAYAPFWAGWTTIEPIVHQTGRLVWSPGTLLVLALEQLPGAPSASLARALLIGTWLVVCLLVLRAGTAAHTSAADHDHGNANGDQSAALARDSLGVLLASVLLLTTAVFGHYFVPAVALASVAANRRLGRLVLWLSIGGLAAYGAELFALAVGPDWVGSVGYQLLGSLALLGPPAVAECCAYWKLQTIAGRPATA